MHICTVDFSEKKKKTQYFCFEWPNKSVVKKIKGGILMHCL